MKKIFGLLSLLLCICITMNGQEKTISGTVSTDTGELLPGVSVFVKGTTNGTITDVNGNYSLQVNDSDIVVVSFIGFNREEKIVSGESNSIHFVLHESLVSLDEVVAVGYGTQRKKDVTTSIARVDSEALSKETNGNVASTLQGKASGVQIIGSSGGPGDSPSVLVRGFTTINSSTNPLYVVDGIPVVDTDGNAGINFLNPDDIESIEVLKDAAAAAIYGTRASAGVILITTKRGEKGRAKFDFSLTYGQQALDKPYETMKSEGFAEAINTAYENSHLVPLIDDTSNLNYTDWWDIGTRTYSPRMNANLKVSGGSDIHQYLVGLSYFKQESFYNVGDWERISARINNDWKFSEWISIGLDLNPRYESWEDTPSWYGDYLLIDPITPVYVPEQNLTGDENKYSIYQRSYYTTVWNPVGRESRQKDKGSSNKYGLTTNAHLDIKPIPNLLIRSQGGLTYENETNNIFNPKFSIDDTYEYNEISSMSRKKGSSLSWSWQNTATYQIKKDKHSGSAMIGITAEEQQYDYVYGYAEGYSNTSEAMRELDGSNGTVTDAAGNSYENSIASYISRLTYNFDDKYLLSATFRRDGSSKFLEKNKWANFPSASVAWRFTAEDGLQKHLPFLSDGKIFAGWGMVGNQSLPSNVYYSTLYTDYYVFGDDQTTTSNTNSSSLKNEDIRWEKVEEKNIGIDLNFLNSMFTTTIEVYQKTTKDMLFEKTYPYYGGIPNWGQIWTNIGEMESKGYDLSFAYHLRKSKFQFDASATLSSSKMKMNQIEGSEQILGGYEWNGENTTRMVVGDEPGYFYGYKTDGLFQNQYEVNSHSTDHGVILQEYAQAGDIRFVNTNGDDIIDSDDRVKIGSPFPDFTGGLNLSGKYKTHFGDFDCSVNLYFSMGADAVNWLKYYKYDASAQTNFASDALSQAWHGEGTSNDIPILNYYDLNENYSKFSDFYVEDASFLRLQTVQVGYTLPKTVCETIKVSNARIYLSGQNLATWTKFGGVNPETDFSPMGYGFSDFDYPLQRTFLFGVNVSF